MARVVESVVPEFGDAVQVETVITTKLEGGMRYQEISKDLGRPAPVPSIFIQGELVFEQTPGQEELKECLIKYLEKPAP
jgi:hypothetical protein